MDGNNKRGDKEYRTERKSRQKNSTSQIKREWESKREKKIEREIQNNQQQEQKKSTIKNEGKGKILKNIETKDKMEQINREKLERKCTRKKAYRRELKFNIY